MGQNLIDKIQAKLELWRLEQRYTRRRHRRSTFVSNAIYVDGEYVFQTPNSTGSSADTDPDCRIDALHGEKPVVRSGTKPAARAETMNATAMPMDSATPAGMPAADRKRLHRFSSIPGFGTYKTDAKNLPRVEERRTSMIR